MPALQELERDYKKFRADRAAQQRFARMLSNYVGRPTALYFAENLSRQYKAKIYLKREDLAHTGAHKINNALGQALLARYRGKKRIIAETGAGQHGVAAATAAARLGLECVVYMGEVDIQRQQPNVYRMRLLGAKVVPVASGSKTLKDAINEALRDWITNVESSHYLLGSALGPHPYPAIVRDFQSVIGREAYKQIKNETGKLPDYLVACVGGGSNAIGLFAEFLAEKKVQMVGVEAGGRGLATGKHAARFAGGKAGILHGTKSYVLENSDGQIKPTYSVSAGLDYPGVGPEHSFLRAAKRVRYVSATDKEALAACVALSQSEGIIPALESAHAVAYALKLAKRNPGKTILVNLSGRGDKDLEILMDKINLRS